MTHSCPTRRSSDLPEVQVFSIQLKVPELHRDVLRSIDGAIPIDAKDCPSAHSLGLEWIERFIVQASTEQLTAFELVADAANACGGDLSYKETPERDRKSTRLNSSH